VEHDLARLDRSVAREELRDPGRDDQRARLHARQWLAFVVLGLPQAVALHVLETGERLRQHLDLGDPLHVRHPVPTRNDQPERVAVLRRQRRAVHLVREQNLVAKRLLERERTLERLLLPALDPAVETGEEHLDSTVGQTGFFE
jgi:hypothetical protein